ncbi:muts domain V-domain-containing protein [Lineolata rhizophorae]|uniref:DNA mismatch repair protein n=1 Tax=Lineolata rhizophorae TaxID=578093 RepID=A0A6A6NRL0_9PEZI|nr:muts domain V-domain-containing protein [Lineolata rhizophorae]
MPRGVEGNEVASTPKPSSAKGAKKGTPTLQQQSSGKTQQRSILGFFAKKPAAVPAAENASSAVRSSSPVEAAASSPMAGKGIGNGGKVALRKDRADIVTPVPSSDIGDVGDDAVLSSAAGKRNGTFNKENGLLPSPVTPSGLDGADERGEEPVKDEDSDAVMASSPPRKARKSVNYAESDQEDDEDEEVFRPISANTTKSRVSKRRKFISDDEDEEFGIDGAADDVDEDDMDDFIVPDDSDAEVVPKKRKRKSAGASKPSKKSSSPPPVNEDEDGDLDMPSVSTAQQWKFDPANIKPSTSSARPKPKRAPSSQEKKPKAHTTEPEQRYPWLANLRDADGNPPGHPDYDPRTIYIPPLAWNKFSPFEKQYWEIKQKFWDTIVFFKKGKFYELYENDATIGHQLFDLKLTDRVNMRMVGVPEASLDMWANQFVAKGYKIARVDQMETALGKEMRERDAKPSSKVVKSTGKDKENKVIRRELSAVLTAGTLVDGGMLQDDMSTFCVAIKEFEKDDRPVFGIAFVDAATAQFHISEFVDDVDMTRFETFVAQTRPGELLLEKSCISARALRILKNNTSPTTIWNYLKPGKEFWDADVTIRELDANDYFVSEDDKGAQAWPAALREAKQKEMAMSAFGALCQYLRMLKIDRDLVSLGNVSWYDPIRKATSLVLDGQSLINLEIFANSFDGGVDGTLFAMLNRCVTPFGKRMLRQWICHPLADARKINARLDAVDALLADPSVTQRFTASLSKLPDLERLISRVHAGRCKPSDFVKVIEGFEQIDYTMSLLREFGAGDGVIGQLISSMPDMSKILRHWKDAFDHEKARKEGLLIPAPGVESDFDGSQEEIDDVLQRLDKLLHDARRQFGSSAICFRDNGKEIYQLEVPIKIKNVPKSWDQMSATAKVKRYYTPELRKLVRELQEAQETHGQIAKEVAGRFFARFDEDYATWLAAVKGVAHLDCLISLARASAALGTPSCRPEFVETGRTTVEFEELRHPCMLASVQDFIPNDVRLGGESPNIDLMTGANASGKSTILRMTCIAVILAQIGTHLPCTSARLTPIDRIMSRLGANDNIFGAQSTFFVELSETKKILSESSPRSLVILDELGRGTSSHDGIAVAQAVLHHLASHTGCVGFFATHYRSLAAEFEPHPEVRAVRMRINVDDEARRVTFLYRLEDGVAEGSFGMHCAAMCGIPAKVVEGAEEAARRWEHTSRLGESVEEARRKRIGSGADGEDQGSCYFPLGMQSDVAWYLREDLAEWGGQRGLEVLRKAIESL